ncbi:TlpA disulfide reductase family protein [Stappia sp. ES.058]|uniref:thiol:disulfide interchange protein TlpA n=1 Tax=Stappia sp. ES.058 TaxID=1881061 RepID=UPI00087C0B43|nr:TlpA disulfide reductase family protein [Stappia sp. ES.058]SDU40711.1 Thiol-disulfide isomerase or thioredoxin [Stappia sp. ES.058]
MTNGPKTRRTRPIVFAALAALVLLAGLAAVYVIGGPDGNQQQTASCTGALQVAETIAAKATGEVAAFLPARKPLSLADLAFKDDSGADRTVADFAGRTILLNLWATWCAPCRKEMPALDALQTDLGSPDFEVVTVSVDRGSDEKPKAFLKDIGVSRLAFYADPTMEIFQTARSRGRAPGLPSTMLIDETGCEIGTLMGPAEWASEDAKALIRAALGESGN